MRIMSRNYWKLIGLWAILLLVAIIFFSMRSILVTPGKLILTDGIVSKSQVLSNNSQQVQTYVIKKPYISPSREHLVKDSLIIHYNSTVKSKTVTVNAHVSQEKEVRHIGFLKIHKAASSTMQNLFFRFGLKRNLTFVFTQHPNYFSRTIGSHIPLVAPKYRTGYDILCNHGIFDYKVYSSILPKDSVYIGIVRDPLSLFASAVNYYSQKSQMIPYIGKIPGNKVENLIRYPDKYDRGFFTYTKNSMARDFGFPPFFDDSHMSKHLEHLDKTIKLVLIVEHFEESLVLMRRYLNWKLQDILFISNNVLGKRGNNNSNLSADDIAKFKIRNGMDYKVYNFFYEKFWSQFKEEPVDIQNEVSYFKQVLEKLYTFCKSDINSNTLTIAKSRWNEELYVEKSDCKYMQMDEQVFISFLRQRQGSELPRRKPQVLRVLRHKRAYRKS